MFLNMIIITKYTFISNIDNIYKNVEINEKISTSFSKSIPNNRKVFVDVKVCFNTGTGIPQRITDTGTVQVL